jgi:dihydroorotate dehydrogenase (NAD+) catalytic subunit
MTMDSAASGQKAAGGLASWVGRLWLGSPLVIAAGPWSAGEAPALTLPAEAQAAGALVSKTVTLRARAGNPEPTVRAAPGGLLNRIGLRNPGVTEFLAQRLPRLLALPAPVLISVAAEQPGELAELLGQLEAGTEEARVVGYELNASCPNLEGEPPTPPQLRELLIAARRQTARPLWVKLGYAERTSLCERARACAEGGADALVATNTVPALAVSVVGARQLNEESPPFVGGLSGASLHPLALRAVWELTRAQALPVIGCGGVRSLAEALSFFAVGAAAVQLGTALYPPASGAPEPVLPALQRELAEYLQARGVPSLTQYLQGRR